MKQSFGAELARIEGKIKESASWPSPGTGLAFHILQLLEDSQSHWPNSVKISFPEGHLDTAPLIAAAGYSMCVVAPNSDQFARWQSALHRFTKRDPFPRDRQTFAFRPPELVAIALGISKSNIGGSPTAAWIRSVIETLPNKNPAQDVWASLLHHYAAALVGVSWPIILPSRLADYELPELCLLFALLKNGKIPQPAEVENRKVATAIVQRAVAITQDVREPEKLSALVAGISLALRSELEDFNTAGSNLAPAKIEDSEDSQQSSHNDASRPLVVLVHGIRTSGKWIRRIKPILEAEGDCVVEPAGFGFFDVFRFVLPGPTRKTVIETVKWKLIHAIDRHKDRPLIIVAHSFGTFCITEILKQSPQIRPARLLFCGSIVAQNFRWDSLSQMSPDRGMRVVNECGARDIWPPLAHSVTFGYGSSGTGGFQVPGVEDRCHDLGHSGYFTKEFVQKFWVPFIKDGTITHSNFEEDMPEAPWWISVLGLRLILPWIVWLLLGLLVCITILGLNAFKDPKDETHGSAELPAKVISVHQSQKIPRTCAEDVINKFSTIRFLGSPTDSRKLEDLIQKLKLLGAIEAELSGTSTLGDRARFPLADKERKIWLIRYDQALTNFQSQACIGALKDMQAAVEALELSKTNTLILLRTPGFGNQSARLTAQLPDLDVMKQHLLDGISACRGEFKEVNTTNRNGFYSAKSSSGIAHRLLALQPFLRELRGFWEEVLLRCDQLNSAE